MRGLGARLFVIGLCSGPVWFGLSKIVKSPRRVLWHVTLCSALAVPPVVAMFGLMTAGYFVLFSQTSLVRALQYLAIAFAAAVWIGIDLQGLRKRVVATRYMEREFIEFDDHVELRWERKTDIEAPPVSNTTLLGRLWNQHGWKIVVVIAPLPGAGYAMSRLLERAGGDEAVWLVLAVLGMPLCIATLSKLVCGAYLNVYKVLHVERRTGKPVLFDHIPAE